MQYEFLKSFPKRMKKAGQYAILFMNSSQKAIWKQYDFTGPEEQLNMIFSVLLYIMEQSLKEENCTSDDIASFIDNINGQYYRKPMAYSDCHALGDFIINVVLSNEGKPMHFTGYDYESMGWQPIHISYVSNRVVYLDNEIRRTSYYLTEDGYNLLLGTLEVEDNLKLTVQELVFKMHLEKQSYEKALDDVRNIFNQMRIQMQKIHEAMARIRRNTLNYKVSDHIRLLEEDQSIIRNANDNFQGYRENVKARVKEIQSAQIDIGTLDRETEGKLQNLKEIGHYLDRAMDEFQKIMNGHFDLRDLYSEELEKLFTQMPLIRRFHYRTEVYDKVLENPWLLERIDLFLSPLFNREPDKIFNINKALEAQKVHMETQEDDVEYEDFDDTAWKAEQERIRQEKHGRYKGFLKILISEACKSGKASLSAIREAYGGPEEEEAFPPSVEIFKEVMVELVKTMDIDTAEIRHEQASFIQEEPEGFQLGRMVLEIIDGNPEWSDIRRIHVEKAALATPVLFSGVPSGDGIIKNIRCTDVEITVIRE